VGPSLPVGILVFINESFDMNIRTATFDDLDSLVLWAREFHAMSFFKNHAFSPQGTKNFLTMMIRNPSFVILMHDNGAIGGSIENNPFCNARVAKELFWYAERDGIQLLSAFSGWANDNAADIEFMSSIHPLSKNGSTLHKLMNRRGYELVENTYIRRHG